MTHNRMQGSGRGDPIRRSVGNVLVWNVYIERDAVRNDTLGGGREAARSNVAAAA